MAVGRLWWTPITASARAAACRSSTPPIPPPITPDRRGRAFPWISPFLGNPPPAREGGVGGFFGARRCVPVYNALDPSTHHPVPAELRFAVDLAFLGNRLPDREARVEEFFLRAAALQPDRCFLIGGNGWHDKRMPPNVQHIGHV